MSNEPINGNASPILADLAARIPELPGLVIARVPITLEGGQTVFAVDLREPGIVRAATFWMQTPKVLASAMRGIEPVPQPMLFVECREDGELRRHTFAIVPTDAPLGVKEGFAASYRATALLQLQAGLLSSHLFEIVKVSS